jgi:GT2 family glycosyltransferase
MMAQLSRRGLGGKRSSQPFEWAGLRTLLRRARVVLTRLLRPILPNPLFDRDWYAAAYPDTARFALGGYTHFRRHGWKEGRRPNKYFDSLWYLQRYPDVGKAGINPLDHYLQAGAAQGRDPSPDFDTAYYLRENPDVASAGLNPLLHFLRFGQAEGRRPKSPAGVEAQFGTPPHLRHRAVSRLAGPVLSREAADAKAVRHLAALVPAVLPNATAVVFAGVPPAASGLPLEPLSGPSLRPLAALSATGLVGCLETRRAEGAGFLAVPPAALMAIQRVPEFAAHLASRYRLVHLDAQAGRIYDLRRVLEPDEVPAELQVHVAVARFLDSYARPPFILDLSGASLAASVAARVANPPKAALERRKLPHLDGTIDMVVLEAGDTAWRSEARRVARGAVISVGKAEGSSEVEWIRRPEQPRVRASIVVTNNNAAAILERCLRSVAETVSAMDGTEVIVVDDASDDGSLQAIRQVVDGRPGWRLIVSEVNRGYVASANEGAAAARGEFLVFLNNDTVVTPGWLHALLQTFADHPGTGVAGSRLLYPDGTLQEAGGVVFRDGSAAKFGAHDPNPDAPVYAFLREVDYVSGAACATPTELFRRLSGFDAVYGFGYYEDTDYCFRVRAQGLRVIYQPRSVVVHVEGATAGRDLDHGPKRAQRSNRDVFSQRWRHELRRQPDPPTTDDVDDYFAAAWLGPGPRT